MRLRAEHALSSGHALFQQPLLRSERSWNGFRANDARPGVELLIHLHGVRSIALQIEPRLRAQYSLRRARFSGRIELQTQFSLLEHSRSAWEQLEYFACERVPEPQLKTSICCGRPAATSGAASKPGGTVARSDRSEPDLASEPRPLRRSSRTRGSLYQAARVNCGSAVIIVISFFTWPTDQPRHAIDASDYPVDTSPKPA
jgi:hypothetical protein